MEKLRAEHISKTFEGQNGPVLALDDVSFSIEEGEFVVIVGPSGCGKSSLLNILGGLDEASEGSVYVAGEKISGPGKDRGMVFLRYVYCFPKTESAMRTAAMASFA